MKRKNLTYVYLVHIFIISAAVYGQNDSDINAEILIRSQLEYERPLRLQEEDRLLSRSFAFSQGLEIISDIENAKVYIFEEEVGRTPYEDDEAETAYVRIRLEKPGYPDYTLWANIRKDYRTTVWVRFKDKLDDSAVPERMSHSNGGNRRKVYSSFNPDDPSYYTLVYRMPCPAEKKETPCEELAGADLLISKDGGSIVNVSRENGIANDAENDKDVIYRWNGKDASGEEMQNGTYDFILPSGETNSFSINRNNSRRGYSYFSGISGLALVPSAIQIFPGSFQFASSFAFERIRTETRTQTNLPFAFHLIVSPLERWETALEGEASIINESDEPSVKISTSQKISLLQKKPLKISFAVRGSYECAANEFKDALDRSFIRNPAGVSAYLPMQFRYGSWDFLLSPEFIATAGTLGDSSGDRQMNGALRWGVSYSAPLFRAGLSTALYMPGKDRAYPIMQAGLEGSFYIPDTPMFLNAFTVIQRTEDRKSLNSAGLTIGFLI